MGELGSRLPRALTEIRNPFKGIINKLHRRPNPVEVTTRPSDEEVKRGRAVQGLQEALINEDNKKPLLQRGQEGRRYLIDEARQKDQLTDVDIQKAMGGIVARHISERPIRWETIDFYKGLGLTEEGVKNGVKEGTAMLISKGEITFAQKIAQKFNFSEAEMDEITNRSVDLNLKQIEETYSQYKALFLQGKRALRGQFSIYDRYLRDDHPPEVDDPKPTPDELAARICKLTASMLTIDTYTKRLQPFMANSERGERIRSFIEDASPQGFIESSAILYAVSEGKRRSYPSPDQRLSTRENIPQTEVLDCLLAYSLKQPDQPAGRQRWLFWRRNQPTVNMDYLNSRIKSAAGENDPTRLAQVVKAYPELSTFLGADRQTLSTSPDLKAPKNFSTPAANRPTVPPPPNTRF